MWQTVVKAKNFVFLDLALSMVSLVRSSTAILDTFRELVALISNFVYIAHLFKIELFLLLYKLGNKRAICLIISQYLKYLSVYLMKEFSSFFAIVTVRFWAKYCDFVTGRTVIYTLKDHSQSCGRA